MGKHKRIIAYLLEYPLDLPGGAQMSTESLCRSLVNEKEAGFEPVVVCPSLLKKRPEDYPFRICTYGMGKNRIANLLVRTGAFKKILKELAPDIVHIQMPESLITYEMAGIRGIPFVFTDRGMFAGYRKHTMFLMKRALRSASVILTTTETNRKSWLEGSSFKNIERVSNTISSAFADYDETKRAGLYEERGGVFTIGMAGRICEEKDWPGAVELVRKLADTGLKFRVSMVLSVFEDGDEEKVKSISDGIIDAVGRENYVLRQDLTQEQMQEYYYGLDVFVMTSVFESFGKAAVEAMSRKCAVIATDVGGLSEVIGKRENLYIPREGADKAVAYICHAAEDEAFLHEEQEYFYSRYRENFSGERCLREHIRIYEEIGR